MKVINTKHFIKHIYKNFSLIFFLIIIILILFIVYIQYYNWFSKNNTIEGYDNKKKNKGNSKNVTNGITVKITDNANNSKSPFPVGVYSVNLSEGKTSDFILDKDNCPIEKDKNNLDEYFKELVKDYNDYLIINDEITITRENDKLDLFITPTKTDLNKCSYSEFKYYEDIFPYSFVLDINLDTSMNLVNFDDPDQSLYVNDNNVLIIDKLGVIYDKNELNVGYMKQDVYDPLHYFIKMNKHIDDLKQIELHFSIFEIPTITTAP
jgi:hypothetical protein